jgi:hypothetical protein
MTEHPTVNGLPLPDLLVRLIHRHAWRLPSDDVVRKLIPFLLGPIYVYETIEVIARYSFYWPPDDELDEEERELSRIEQEEVESSFRMVHGSRAGRSLDLPWLDLDYAVFLGVGDEEFLALDYRTDVRDPRVVATDWSVRKSEGAHWREVAPTFTQFVKALGLDESGG